MRCVWRYQRGIRIRKSKKNRQHNGEKEKDKRDKQRSTKQTHKTKDRVTRTPLKTGGELRCFGRVSSSYYISDSRRVNLVTNPLISHEWRKDREVLTTSGTYIRGHLRHIYSIAINQVMYILAKRNPWFSSFLVSSHPQSKKSW